MKAIFKDIEKIFIYIILYALIAVISYILISIFLHSLSQPTDLNFDLLALTEISKKVNILILISFLIVLLGCMVVLKGVESSYKLSVDSDKIKSNLETTSPGLVMITLGCALLAFSIAKSFTVTVPVSVNDPVAATKINDDTLVTTTTGTAPDKEATIAGKKTHVPKTHSPQPEPVNNVARISAVRTITGAGTPPMVFDSDTSLVKNPDDKAELLWALKMNKLWATFTVTPTPTQTERFNKIAEKVTALRTN